LPEQALTLAEIAENFELFDDWEERYRYIIDLGRALPPLPEQYKTDDFKVRGCISQVWVVCDRHEAQPARLTFKADSDAAIVKGLVAILLALYSGKTAAEILAIDIHDVFKRLNLEQHISPNRRNGFFAMVERIRCYAQDVS
jgi:cysteine desulfuration protein SufE